MEGEGGGGGGSNTFPDMSGGRRCKARKTVCGEPDLFSADEDMDDLVPEQHPLVVVVVVVHEVLVILRIVVVDDAAVPLAIIGPVDAQPATNDTLLRGRIRRRMQQAPGLDGYRDRLAQRCGLPPLPHTGQDGMDGLELEPPVTTHAKV